MAARKASTSRSGGNITVNVSDKQSRAVARRPRRSGGTRRRKSSSRGRRSKGGLRVGSLTDGSAQIKFAVGGWLAGMAIKNWGKNIPRVPGLGRMGTIACIPLVWKTAPPLVKDASLAAAAIAGWTFAETGSIAGDDEDLISRAL